MKVSYVLDKQERCKRIMSQAQKGPIVISSPGLSQGDLDNLASQYTMFMTDHFNLSIKYYSGGNLDQLWKHFHICELGGRALSYSEVNELEAMDSWTAAGSLINLVKRNNINSDHDAALLVNNCLSKINTIFMALFAFVSHLSYNNIAVVIA